MKNIVRTTTTFLMFLTFLLTTSCDAFMTEDEKLEASGSIEATEILLTSEFGGTVAEITVQEGDHTDAKQVLVRFDDAYLQTQYEQAQASLAQAKANLKQVKALSAQEILAAQQALDDLYENAELARSEAQIAVTEAQDELARAKNEALQVAQYELEYAQLQDSLEDLIEDREAMDYQRCKESTTNAAYADYIMAKEKLEDLEKDYNNGYAWKKEDDLSRAIKLAEVSEAKRIYDRAFANWNYCKESADQWEVSEKDAQIHLTEANIAETKRLIETYSTPDEDGISKAQSNIDLAEAKLEQARLDLKKLQDGPDPDEVELAKARLEVAESGLDIAETQVQVAEAALSSIEVQIEKLLVTSPTEATILVRLIEPGEVLSPGAPLLTLAQLDNLTITVYLPEDRYGQIKIGQNAQVSVDSYPDEVFEATVIRIADEAEYTPRNVQTEEDRRTTVFAIELSVDDPEGKLKPGMPADVIFGSENSEDSK